MSSQKLTREESVSLLSQAREELQQMRETASAFDIERPRKQTRALRDRLELIESQVPLRSCPTFARATLGSSGYPAEDLRREIDHYIAVSDRILAQLEDETTWRLARHEGETKLPMLEAKDPRRVFIIHGRNLKLVEELRLWLRALNLEPVAFDELRASLGGTPTITDVIAKGMSEAQAVIALFTGDEHSTLRPELRSVHSSNVDISRWQARPNVMFEAGMAFAIDREHVTFWVAGTAELFSDVSGIHYQRLDDNARTRTLLKTTLERMGCAVNGSPDHLDVGKFENALLPVRDVRDPFA